jgi:3-isopropylmalate/(R)-2-methylmalate dehydratase small subunit
MKPFTTHTGVVAALDRANVDTDQIIPKQFLKRIERTGFGEFAFDEWRKDPNFVLNDRRYDGAAILVTGPNFGCGSSREHAPWALEDFGFKAIIAPSFADIFYGNCTKIGLLPVVLPEDVVTAIMGHGECEIDLPNKVVRFDGDEVPFDLDDSIHHRLVNGLDDIGMTLQQQDAIAAYEADRERTGPNTKELAA